MDQKVFVRGDYHNLGDPVERTVPAILRLSAPRPRSQDQERPVWNWPTGLSIRAIRFPRA